MSLHWQDIAVALVVLAAVVYLLQRGWAVVRHKRAGGCAGCASGCKVTSQAGELPIVDLGEGRAEQGPGTRG